LSTVFISALFYRIRQCAQASGSRYGIIAAHAPDLELEERLFGGVDAAMTETPTQDLGGTATTDEFTAFVIGKLDR
jgi:hypothetical protein